MAISQELEILACPACKAKVELEPDGSGLKCVECKKVYPIRDDMVMLVDEVRVKNSHEQPARHCGVSATARSRASKAQSAR
jgi:uncharacterized protein YbaR (Trm112 family)